MHFSRSAYLHQVVRGSFLWLIFGGFALYLLLGGLAIWLSLGPMYSYMIGAVLAARTVSYVLYPNGDQRYTAVLYVVILVALVIGVRESTLMRGSRSTSEMLENHSAKGWRSRVAVPPNPSGSGAALR